MSQYIWDLTTLLLSIVVLGIGLSLLWLGLREATLSPPLLIARLRIIGGSGVILFSLAITLVGSSAFIENEAAKFLIYFQFLMCMIAAILLFWKATKEKKATKSDTH